MNITNINWIEILVLYWKKRNSWRFAEPYQLHYVQLSAIAPIKTNLICCTRPYHTIVVWTCFLCIFYLHHEDIKIDISGFRWAKPAITNSMKCKNLLRNERGKKKSSSITYRTHDFHRNANVNENALNDLDYDLHY